MRAALPSGAGTSVCYANRAASSRLLAAYFCAGSGLIQLGQAVFPLTAHNCANHLRGAQLMRRALKDIAVNHN